MQLKQKSSGKKKENQAWLPQQRQQRQLNRSAQRTN